MRKDSSEVFRARGSDEVRSLLLVFWAIHQDSWRTVCAHMPTAVATWEDIRYTYGGRPGG